MHISVKMRYLLNHFKYACSKIEMIIIFSIPSDGNKEISKNAFNKYYAN